MFRSRRLFYPALVATFIGGALGAGALTSANASSGPGGPQSPITSWQAPARAAGVTPASAGCTVHLTAGATPAQNYDVCINGHGNVNGFSWGSAAVGGPFQYLDNEGYCITRDALAASHVNYWDGGSISESGFGVASTLMGSTKTYTVTRTTTDGTLKLVQNFFLKPATSQLFIGMQITNLDSVAHDVLVERFFHPKIGGNSTSLNWEDHKQQATSADDGTQGIQLALLSRNLWTGPGGLTANGGRAATPGFASTLGTSTYCNTAAVGLASTPGDNYGGVAAENGYSTPAIPPGGTQTFQMAYRIY